MAIVLTLVDPHLARLIAVAASPGAGRRGAIVRGLLPRAVTSTATIPGLEAGLYGLAGGDPETRVAVAPVTWLYDTGTPAGPDCWRADPVHIRVGTSAGAVLLPEALRPGADEAATLVSDIAEALDWPAGKLVAAVPERWYIRDTGWPDITTASPFEAAQGDLADALPRGSEAAPIRLLMSEIQIVLGEHPVNRERQRLGLPTINSLWFWGGGSGNERLQRFPLPRLFGEDAFLGGLGRLMEEKMRPLPTPCDKGFWRCLDRETVVLLTSGDACAPGAWQDVALERLEAWLARARRELLRGRLRALRLADAQGRLFRWRRTDLLKIWRRKLPAGRDEP